VSTAVAVPRNGCCATYAEWLNRAIPYQSLPQRFKPPGPDTFPASTVKTLLAKPDNIVFLAHVGSRGAGYAYAEIVRRPETTFHFAYEMIYVHHISVGQSFRKHGVGRALVDAVRKVGTELGITNLALDVWAFNEEACSFFRRCGFTPYNHRLWIQ
jgi:GNAT superfamily N-acetyltransferase